MGRTVQNDSSVECPLLTVRRGAMALVLLAGLVYAHALGGAFIWDDEYLYFDNPRLFKETIISVFSPDVYPVQQESAQYMVYRPLQFLAHSWLARLFGLQPFGLHFASLAVHAAAAVLAFLLLLEFVEIRVAWIAAALFVVHPVHVEAVAWMAAFSEVLAGALMLLSLYALVRAQRGPRWLLAVSYLAAAMAFLTKETALALPLMAALFVRRRAWPLFAIAGGALLLRFATLGHGVAGLPQRPLLGHLHVIAAAALQYTKKLIWPWPLAPEYHLAHPPAAWVAFAIVCALAAWAATRYREMRVALLLVFLPMTPVLASSVVLPAMRQAQDRYAYVAVLGLALLIGCAARTRAATVAATAVLLVWGALSVVAIHNWRHTETLWTHTLRVTPSSKTAVMSLGYLYYTTGRFAEADRIYQQGLLLRPHDPDYLTSHAAVRKVLEQPR